MLEVEQKYPLAEPAALVERLLAAGVELAPAVEQVDQYLAHPARDFAATDEALRIRRVGQSNRITYKGPKLDATTKTRREIELPLAEGSEAASRYNELFQALGFRPVMAVRKLRRCGHLAWQGRDFEVALDDVAGLGHFAELETTADETELEAAQAALADLALKLGLTQTERRSYLELLLEKSGDERA